MEAGSPISPVAGPAEAATERRPGATVERWVAYVERPESCKVCRACARACRAGALTVAVSRQEWVHVDAELCTGCGDCVEACPQQMLTVRLEEVEP